MLIQEKGPKYSCGDYLLGLLTSNRSSQMHFEMLYCPDAPPLSVLAVRAGQGREVQRQKGPTTNDAWDDTFVSFIQNLVRHSFACSFAVFCFAVHCVHSALLCSPCPTRLPAFTLQVLSSQQSSPQVFPKSTDWPSCSLGPNPKSSPQTQCAVPEEACYVDSNLGQPSRARLEHQVSALAPQVVSGNKTPSPH